MWQCDMYDTVQISIQKKKGGKERKIFKSQKKNTPFSHFHFSNALKREKLTTNSPATSEQNFVQKAN